MKLNRKLDKSIKQKSYRKKQFKVNAYGKRRHLKKKNKRLYGVSFYKMGYYYKVDGSDPFKAIEIRCWKRM